MTETYPWLIRGGHYADDSSTGIFYYDAPSASGDGSFRSMQSFRVALIK